jgi:hypothetical protein
MAFTALSILRSTMGTTTLATYSIITLVSSAIAALNTLRVTLGTTTLAFSRPHPIMASLGQH